MAAVALSAKSPGLRCSQLFHDFFRDPGGEQRLDLSEQPPCAKARRGLTLYQKLPKDCSEPSSLELQPLVLSWVP